MSPSYVLIAHKQKCQLCLQISPKKNNFAYILSMQIMDSPKKKKKKYTNNGVRIKSLLSPKKKKKKRIKS